MDYFECWGSVNLLNRTIRLMTIGANVILLAFIHDFLEYGRFPQHIRSRTPHLLQQRLSLGIAQQYARARLANALEQVQRVLHVPYVEDGECQLDVTEVPRAIGQLELARRARANLI